MMNYLVRTALFATLLLIVTGCEKDINLPLKTVSNEVVVDASIENGQPPVVFLSTSFGYFSKISAPVLASSFIHGAKIMLRSGTDSALLKEYAYPVGAYQVYFYSLDTAAGAGKIIGKLSTSYTLSIETSGKKYTGQTTIPAILKRTDSLWAKPAPNNKDSLKRVLFARVYDPPGLGNYIRYFTSVNDSAFLPGLNSVYDDDVVDGTTYDIQVFKGANRDEKIDEGEYGYFKKGDTVTIKLCNIDRATYDFWRTLEYVQQSIGNPFSQPGVVLSNMKGGALGYFGGYAAQYKKIIITK
jgi:hypothetical protein